MTAISLFGSFTLRLSQPGSAPLLRSSPILGESLPAPRQHGNELSPQHTRVPCVRDTAELLAGAPATLARRVACVRDRAWSRAGRMDRPWRGQLVEVTRDVAIERLDHGAVVRAAEWRARDTKDAASPDRAAADHTVTQLVTPSRVPVRRHGSGHSQGRAEQ